MDDHLGRGRRTGIGLLRSPNRSLKDICCIFFVGMRIMKSSEEKQEPERGGYLLYAFLVTTVSLARLSHSDGGGHSMRF